MYILSHTDAGVNDVQILYASQNSLIMSLDNVDENGTLSTLIGIFGRYDSLT